MKRWQLQDAKAKLSDVVKSTVREGPQEITVRGRAAVVVLSIPDYRRLRGAKPSFIDFIRRSPLAGTRIAIRRDRTAARPAKL